MTRGPLASALLGFAVAACGYGGTRMAAADNACTLSASPAPEAVAVMAGDCAHDARGIAAAIVRAPQGLKAGGELALGRVPFVPAGAFDRCAVMARLAADPRWTASIDSSRATVPLRAALTADELAPAISGALAKAGHRLRGVSLEAVLLSDGPAKGCAASPAKVPTEARLWLSLD